MVVGYSWRAQDDIAVKMAHTISLSSALAATRLCSGVSLTFTFRCARLDCCADAVNGQAVAPPIGHGKPDHQTAEDCQCANLTLKLDARLRAD